MFCRITVILLLWNCLLKFFGTSTLKTGDKKYHAGAESEEMFRQAGIKLEYFIEEIEKYDNQ